MFCCFSSAWVALLWYSLKIGAITWLCDFNLWCDSFICYELNLLVNRLKRYFCQVCIMYEGWSRNTRKSVVLFLLIKQSLWYFRNLIFDLFWILEAYFKTREPHCFNGIVTLATRVCKQPIIALYFEFDFLFNLILYVPSTIFQLYRDGSSWVEPVLS